MDINDVLIPEFSGFLIGFSFHSILHKIRVESIYRLIIKYLAGVRILFLSYKFVSGDPLLILTVFILDGLLIPTIRFRI